MAYTAVVLTEESRQRLITSFAALLTDLPEGWLIKCHHMTVDMKPADKSMAVDFIGQEVDLEITRFGQMHVAPGAGIFAVEVKCVVPSKNQIKHITMAHHNSVKPVKSNDITDWQDSVDTEPVILRGVVQEVA